MVTRIDTDELENVFNGTAESQSLENAWAMERLADPGFQHVNQAFIKSVCGIIVQALAQFIAIKDPKTYRHSQRVMNYVRAGACELGLTQPEIENIRHAGMLHDLGKIYIPECILQSTDPLNDDQKWIIHMHPGIGAGALSGIPFLKAASEIVLHHHEKYDGTGYPDSLCGNQIPLGSRIMAIADAFEAMTADRPYRIRPLTDEEAIAELMANSGTQFDPSLLPVMCRVFSQEPGPATA